MPDRVKLWQVHGAKENCECSVEYVAEDLFELVVQRGDETVVDEDFEDVGELLRNAERLHVRTEHDAEEDLKDPDDKSET
jgi:hypothetical protein